MDWDIFFERLDRLRDTRGYSDQSLSLQAGLSRDGIRNWRRKVKKDPEGGPNLASVQKVADTLDVDVAYLIGESSLHRLPTPFGNPALAYSRQWAVDAPIEWSHDDMLYIENFRESEANIMVGASKDFVQVVAKVTKSGFDTLQEKLGIALSRLG